MLWHKRSSFFCYQHSPKWVEWKKNLKIWIKWLILQEQSQGERLLHGSLWQQGNRNFWVEATEANVWQWWGGTLVWHRPRCLPAAVPLLPQRTSNSEYLESHGENGSRIYAHIWHSLRNLWKMLWKTLTSVEVIRTALHTKDCALNNMFLTELHVEELLVISNNFILTVNRL